MADVIPTATELERRAEAFELLASKFPRRYAVKGTQYLRGLLEALSVGDGFIASQIEASRDNLVAVTATGSYLDRRAGLYGIVRGQGAGLLDEDFQRLIPKLGLSPKQITNVMLQLIDTIYGPYASHANSTSAFSEPYVLEDGFNLRVRVDNEELEVIFETEDAFNISAATAQEMATAISKKTKGRIIGSVLTNARTGQKFLNIRTSTIGSQGFLQVLGGDAQAKLQFPEIRPVTNAIRVWDVTRFNGTDEMIFTINSGPVPNFKAAGVVRGDFITIRSDSGFDLKNVGTYLVSFVGPNYFRLINGGGVTESAVSQSQVDDFTFYRPDLSNVLLSSRPAAIVETSPRELIVLLPVTSPIVKRSLKGGHHFHQGLTNAVSTTSNSVTIGSVAGFAPTGAIRPVTSRKLSKGTVSSVSGTDVTLVSAAGWPTTGSFHAASDPNNFYYYSGTSGNTLQNVTPTPPPELSGAPVKYIERYMYTAISGSTLTGVFPNPSALAGVEIVATGALVSASFPGGFLFDPTATFVNSKNATPIAETINQGDVKTLLQVADVTDFDSEGHVVIEFGSDNFEGPIRYLAKIGTQGLIVDPSHVFEKDHLKGCTLRMVRQIGPYTPKNDGRDYAIYTTSTSPARDLLASYLRLIAASGVSIRFEIRTPDQKWEVLPNLYSTDPLATELVSV